MVKKLKVAIIPTGSCSGCDTSLVDAGETLVKALEYLDIVYWPIAMDLKVDSLLRAKSIDILIVHGSIRTEEHEHLVKEAAKKAKYIVAYGSCTCFGGIPGLANLFFRDELLRKVYIETFSTVNPEEKIPGVTCEDERLKIPKLLEWIHPLDEIVDVDLYVPGCPPPGEIVEKFLETIIAHAERGEPLPEKGTVLAGLKTVCDECPREKPDKIVVEKFMRISEAKEIDEKKCLLAQGIICMGPATRSGCGAKCLKVNMPCRGCMGPSPEVVDMGAKLISMIGSIVYADREREVGEEHLKKVIEEIVDPAGCFYRFTLPNSILGRTHRRRDKE